MFKLLERYITKTIILATAMTTLIIIGVLFLMTLLGELKSMGEGDYGLVQALIYVLYRMPNELYQFSPMLILLGAIVGLGILSSHRELAVMRASGFSTWRIIHSVLCAALVLVVLISVVGEWFAPNLSYTAEVRKEYARNAGQAVVTAAGVWFHVDNNFVHVKHIVDHELLEGVTRYEFNDNHQLQASYFAETMTYQNHQWMMHDVVKTSFYNDRTRSQSLQQSPWSVQFNKNLLNVGMVDAEEMSLPKLATFSKYLDQNGLQASEYKYEFWQRVFQPIASLVMILLAIPFVMGTLGTTTAGYRVLIGILIGFSFFIFNALLGQICIVYQIPAILAAFLPIFIFILVGIYLSKRMIRL